MTDGPSQTQADVYLFLEFIENKVDFWSQKEDD
jgi:hypothetical protein